MPSGPLDTIPNPDLVVGPEGRENWNVAERRRASFHRLHAIARYGFSLRASDVLRLGRNIDRRVVDMPAVRKLTETPFFSAMVVLRDTTVMFEKYAPDFGPTDAHSVMSISKTALNLIVGKLIDDGLLDPAATVGEHLPEIGSGYAAATIRDVLDMNVVNDYSEDYSDPETTALLHEAAMGWRLFPAGTSEITDREFLCTIASDDPINRSGEPQYKSANTDVLGWIAERVSGRGLRDHFIDIVEAAGIEDSFHMSTDRAGVANLNGGICMTARDLARYGLIFARGGIGVHGETIGSGAFIEATRAGRGPRYPAPQDDMYYCNQMRSNGRWIGHGGWGGQFLLIDPTTRVVVVFLSVLENEDASDWDYQVETIAMAEAITRLAFDD
jgi:CubicO group peptidase (beta-lactamase class C family)